MTASAPSGRVDLVAVRRVEDTWADGTDDNNGNTATKVDSTGTTQYFWDFENRLKSVTLPGSGGTVTFKYDPFGRRIYKSSSSGTSVYAYEGDNLIEETNSTGSVVARYEDTQNIDEPLAMLRSSTHHQRFVDVVVALERSRTEMSTPAYLTTWK